MSTKVRARSTKSELTRARILDIALRLFNENGTAAVSTNHIAREAGLSPGNLYYHFQDKQQIIRELHARYAAAFEGWWELGADGATSLAQLRRNIVAGLRQAWEYRFFDRESRALLLADPLLRADHQAVYRRRLREWTLFGEQLVAQGMVRVPGDPERLRSLNLAIWLVTVNWLAFLDTIGEEPDPGHAAQGADLVLAVLEPYLTDAGRAAMEGARS